MGACSRSIHCGTLRPPGGANPDRVGRFTITTRRLALEPGDVNMKVRLVSCCPSRRRANCSGDPNVSSTPQYLTLTDDNQVLAEATIRSATHRPSIHADLHVEAGHLPSEPEPAWSTPSWT